MLFALLKASLHNVAADTELFVDAVKEDWDHCYNASSKQGVLALAWDGVQTLPVEMHPYKKLKFQWAISVEKYEAKHRKYCQTAQELQHFYKEHGIMAVILKGVGFSSYYNCPAHREGGDIDIYTCSADTSKMSHKEANELADTLMQQQGINVDTDHNHKHSNFTYNGIPIENHKLFLNVEVNPRFLGKLNNILNKVLNVKENSLYNGEFKLKVPSIEFDTLFISCHAFQHYGDGLALHHLYDWATIINKFEIKLSKEVTEDYFLRSIAAFTYLSNKYLGTNVELSHFPSGYEKLADKMLWEMFYSKFTKVIQFTNPISIIIFKIKRLFIRAFYMKSVFGASITRTVLSSVRLCFINPGKILKRG